MTRVEYIYFLSAMDIVVMNHNRLQAVGNTISALVIGQPVFMKKNSVTYSMLRHMNVRYVYDIKKLHHANIDEIIFQAYRDREETIKSLSQLFYEDARLEAIRELLSRY